MVDFPDVHGSVNLASFLINLLFLQTNVAITLLVLRDYFNCRIDLLFRALLCIVALRTIVVTSRQASVGKFFFH
jgi:hypothetical protein